MDDARAIAAGHDASTDEPDEQLALAARSDAAAFAALYERHRLAVFRYLRARTHSDDQAAELTAVTFEKALTAIPRYRTAGGGVVAWLLRIARNAAIDAGRRPSPAPVPVDLPDERPAAVPEQQVLAAERRAALTAALHSLGDAQRDAVLLRYAARLTAREIGTVLGRSEQATQKLITRALAGMREALDDDR